MLGYPTQQSANTDPSVLILWLQRSLLDDRNTFETVIRVKLRGNILHVLCESARPGLSCEVEIARLVRSLLKPKVKTILESNFPQIYQIYLYSRETSAPKPVWSAPIYLTRLERHLEQLQRWEQQAEKAATQWQKNQPKSASTSSSDFDSANSLAVRQSEAKFSTDHSLSAQLEQRPSSVQPPSNKAPQKQRFVEQLPRVSVIDLARKGDLDAIAQCLGKTLRALNIGVQISAKVLPEKGGERSSSVAEERFQKSSQIVSQLWILCEANYSLDPLVVAEPIAQRFRQLRLKRFREAVVTIQVKGEADFGWRLRVDLTPPGQMLQRLARWGDVQALSCLVNQISKRYGLKLIAKVKEDTLHLISYAVDSAINSAGSETTSRLTPSANKNQSQRKAKELVTAIDSRLQMLAPQGLQRAVIYGPSTDHISPEWLENITLPASDCLALRETAQALATTGDIEALSYCLTRALNPAIREQLATGGFRVQVLEEGRLLHIMVEGPICPLRAVVVPLISQLLKQIQPPEIDGVRLYGRRAGQKQSFWSYGRDYRAHKRLEQRAAAEFAAADELTSSPSNRNPAGHTATHEDTDLKIGSVLRRTLQHRLLKTRAFTLLDEGDNLRINLSSSFRSHSGKMVLFWGAVGVLLVAQLDFVVGRALRQAVVPLKTPLTTTQTTEDSSVDAQSKWNRPTNEQSNEGFYGSFLLEESDPISSTIGNSELLYSPEQSMIERNLLLAESELPSFRSQQLDEKLALYRRRVKQSGPPDILVIGSSRALRGIDPVALQKALAQSGHKNLSVFNFGLNGATAQVVDLVVRRLIAPNHLPKVIIWADGARAFNSGRTDITYNAIAVSDGYRQLEASDPVNGIDGLVTNRIADQLALRATQADRALSEQLGQVSSAYGDRDKVRSVIGQGLSAILTRGVFWAEPGAVSSELPAEGNKTDGLVLARETHLINSDGFLPLANRFNPATYYQNYPRVAGDYDSDYKAFRMEGEQSDAFGNLLRFTADKKIPIVFVNTPLTDEYLDSHRDHAEDIFSQYMLRVTEHYSNFTFCDLGQLWPEQYDYFSDPSHLNRYGAYRVSQRLSQDPLIPWPQSF